MTPRPMLTAVWQRVGVGAALVLAVLGGAAPATAAPVGTGDAGDFAVYPASADGTERPFFAYDVQPGEVVEDVVRIVNYADEPRTFRTYAADGYNTSDIGTFALRQADEPATDVGAWIDLAVDRWTVPARSQVDVPISIDVPPDATPGDHVGGVVALHLPKGTTEQDAMGLAVQNGIGARMYVRVKGPVRPALAVDAFATTTAAPLSPLSRGRATTTFKITNVGNVRLSPSVAFRAAGALGTIEEADLGEFSDLLPGSSVIVEHEWDGIPAGGRVSQTVTLSSGEVLYSRSTSFWVVPWWAVALVAFGVGLGIWFLRHRRLRPRRTRQTGPTHLRVALAILVVLVATQLGGSATAFADEPRLLVRSDGAVEPGGTVLVSGTQWPARTNVVLEICGNDGRGGSADCAVRDGRTVATSPDGRFATQLTAVEPPAACPCVVRAWTVTGEEAMSTQPLPLVSSGVAPTVSAAPAAPARGSVRVVDAHLEGAGGWAERFGGAPTRTLVLSLENEGEVAVDDVVASVAWGTGEGPDHYLPLVAIGRLEAGEAREHRVEVHLEPFTFGDIALQGEVLGGGDAVPFTATTSSQPWALIALIAGTLTLVLVASAVRIRNRARRRRAAEAAPRPAHRRLPAGEPTQPLWPAPAALVAVATTEVGLPPLEAAPTLALPAAPSVVIGVPSRSADSEPKPIVVAPSRMPVVTGPLFALRVVHLTAQLQHAAAEAIEAMNLSPREEARRVHRSERSLRDLAESLVLATASCPEELIDSRRTPPPATLALPPARAILTV